MTEREYRCNCARFCKLPTGKKVGKSTYYAHAIYRKALSPVPGGFRVPDIPEGVIADGGGLPIAELFGGNPPNYTQDQVEIYKAVQLDMSNIHS